MRRCWPRGDHEHDATNIALTTRTTGATSTRKSFADVERVLGDL